MTKKENTAVSRHIKTSQYSQAPLPRLRRGPWREEKMSGREWRWEGRGKVGGHVYEPWSYWKFLISLILFTYFLLILQLLPQQVLQYRISYRKHFTLSRLSTAISETSTCQTWYKESILRRKLHVLWSIIWLCRWWKYNWTCSKYSSCTLQNVSNRLQNSTLQTKIIPHNTVTYWM